MRKADEAKRLNEMLYSGLSNDIEGPVNVILNAAEYLEKRFYDQPELLSVIYAIDDSGRYLARLGTNLVELAACLSGGNLPQLRPIDFRGQLCCLLEETAPYAARQKLTLCWEPDKMPLLYLDCDPAMLDNILLKLLSNAIRYSRPGGTIRVEVASAAGQLQIRIQDDGPGLPPQVSSSLFSLHPSGEEPGLVSAGAGLGLYLANEFCRVLGWQLRIESRAEGGTTAVIETNIHADDFRKPAVFHAGDDAAQEIFRYEQRERVRLEMAPLFGRLPETRSAE